MLHNATTPRSCCTMVFAIKMCVVCDIMEGVVALQTYMEYIHRRYNLHRESVEVNQVVLSRATSYQLAKKVTYDNRAMLCNSCAEVETCIPCIHTSRWSRRER